MPEYLLLLYAEEVDEAGTAERWAELPLWNAVTADFEAAGQLIGNNPLLPADMATTVRIRDGVAEITDGPFAVTKEILAGYYLLRCQDLDEAIRCAQRLPTARFGSVEVRPIMTVPG
jgi:hypothetical protein